MSSALLFAIQRKKSKGLKTSSSIWQFWGSNQSNCTFSSSKCYLAKKSQMLQKPLVWFWHFCGSLRLFLQPNYVFTSTPYYSAKESEMLQKPLVQFWHFCGSLRFLYKQITSSPLLYAIWQKKIRNVTKRSCSILTLLWEFETFVQPNYVFTATLCYLAK